MHISTRGFAMIEKVKIPKAELKFRKSSAWSEFWWTMKKEKIGILGMLIFTFMCILAILGPFIAPYSYWSQDPANRLQAPSIQHLMGTDKYGRDILSRIIIGSRVTLLIGFGCVVIALGVSLIIGPIAGYFGGKVDSIITRIIDIWMAFPWFVLAVAIGAIIGPGIVNSMLATGLAIVPSFTRVIRGTVMSVKEQDFILAARALGMTERRIILHHILNNITGPLIVISTLRIATSILNAASLSFLGLGVQEPMPEWGSMLSEGRSYLVSNPHVVFFPGIMILITVLAVNLFGDALRVVLDPKLRV